MEPFLINPIDLSPFIGGSQTPEGQKHKLIKLYEAEAKELLDKGDIDAYNLTIEKINKLRQGDNSSNN